MRTLTVEVATPGLDDDLGLGARPEPFERQALIAELAVEAFRCPVLPGLAGIDQRCLDALVAAMLYSVAETH